MNKTYKYTLSSGEKKEITFGVGVNRLAISNANGTDGGSGGSSFAFTDEETVVGTWNGETLYARIIHGHVNYNSSVIITLPNASYVVGYMGSAYYVNSSTGVKEYQFNIDRLEMQFSPNTHYITFYGRLTYNVDFETVVFYLK